MLGAIAQYWQEPRMTRSVDVRDSGKMKNESERASESDPRDSFFIAAAPLVARGLRARQGGSLARGYRPRGPGGRGPGRAAVINNAAINPGLSPAGMTAFGKKRREPPPRLPSPRKPLSFSRSFSLSPDISHALSLPPSLPPSLSLSLSLFPRRESARAGFELRV